MITMQLGDLFSLKCEWRGEHIYAICAIKEDDSFIPVYVGKTNQSPTKRIMQHVTADDLLGIAMRQHIQRITQWKVMILSVSDCEQIRRDVGKPDLPVENAFDAENVLTKFVDPLFNRAVKRAKTLAIPDDFRPAFAEYRPDIWGDHD